jgi:acetyltransferase-like isoleucine patch superfamily enzyme
MNIHNTLRRLVGRATCVKDPSTRLMSSARIINISKDSARIRLGAKTIVRGELLVYPHGGRIDIGSDCYVGEGTRLWSGASLCIGNRVLISHNVNIIDTLTHPFDHVARFAHAQQIFWHGHPADITVLEDEPIYIEDDAWIAAGAIILKGVRIGRGGVVGAGSVVTADVPPLAVVAGNPARVVRYLDKSVVQT